MLTNHQKYDNLILPNHQTYNNFFLGRLPVHVNENNNDGITDPTMGVHPDMTCIATKLKQAGYSTHAIGKWDAGFASRRQIPKHRGNNKIIHPLSLYTNGVTNRYKSI